jgi:hypothetical protein
VSGVHQQNPPDVQAESCHSIRGARSAPHSGLNFAWIFGDASLQQLGVSGVTVAEM